MSALDDLLPALACPHCGARLLRTGDRVVGCEAGHTFDVARQGYLSLLTGESPHRGDIAEMVAARERFLTAGHFDPLAAALTDRVGAVVERALHATPLVVDLGAGPGWYLARVVEDVPLAAGLALDVSKPALRRAARAHPRIAAVAADAWRPLPLRSRVAAAVLNVFAPRDPAELARLLAPGGRALIVTPAAGHLEELIQPLGLLEVEARKEEQLFDRLGAHLDVVDRKELTWTLTLDRGGARDAAAMGPSAFHVSTAELDERVEGLPQTTTVTAAVRLTTAAAAGAE